MAIALLCGTLYENSLFLQTCYHFLFHQLFEYCSFALHQAIAIMGIEMKNQISIITNIRKKGYLMLQQFRKDVGLYYDIF